MGEDRERVELGKPDTGCLRASGALATALAWGQAGKRPLHNCVCSLLLLLLLSLS